MPARRVKRSVRVRHEVAQLSVLRHLPGVLGMFLPVPTHERHEAAWCFLVPWGGAGC